MSLFHLTALAASGIAYAVLRSIWQGPKEGREEGLKEAREKKLAATPPQPLAHDRFNHRMVYDTDVKAKTEIKHAKQLVTAALTYYIKLLEIRIDVTSHILNPIEHPATEQTVFR